MFLTAKTVLKQNPVLCVSFTLVTDEDKVIISFFRKRKLFLFAHNNRISPEKLTFLLSYSKNNWCAMMCFNLVNFIYP